MVIFTQALACLQVTCKNKVMDASEILKSYELPITKPRKLVLETLIQAESPVTIEDLKSNIKNVNESTLYRNLNKLVDTGIVKKLHLNSAFSHFELNTAQYHQHGHYHIVCSKCKSVTCVDINIEKLLLGQIKKLNYKDVKHKLEFSGICPDCQ